MYAARTFAKEPLGEGQVPIPYLVEFILKPNIPVRNALTSNVWTCKPYETSHKRL